MINPHSEDKSVSGYDKKPHSPFFFITVTVIFVFIFEIITSFIVSLLPSISIYMEIALDASLLIVTTAPVMYFYLFRPMILNLHKRTKAEEALKNNINKLDKAHKEIERLLSSISSILIGVDENDYITRWNRHAEMVFGIPPYDVVRKPFFTCGIKWNWDEVGRLISDCRENEQATRLRDIKYVRTDGKEGFLGLSVNPIKDETTDKTGKSAFLLLGAEITDRKRLKTQLALSQKMESVGQLAAGIAHEINTPTQYVMDNVRFLQDAFRDSYALVKSFRRLLEAARSGSVTAELIAEMDAAVENSDIEYLQEEIPKAIEQSLEGTERVAKIVRAMKEFSHPGTEEKSPVDINRTIESTVTVCRNEWKYVADIKMDLDPSLPQVPCLAGEFNQVILNIIINAAHSIADVVGTGSDAKGTITISTRRSGNHVEICISDTGAGIPEEFRGKIFDPFFTTKGVGKGTGQGLAISHSVIVDKHGGTIEFETEIGKGTKFIIRLPVD